MPNFDPNSEINYDNLLCDTEVIEIDTCNGAECQKFEKKLNVLALNIRSVRKNFNEFICLLKILDLDFSIIILTETWLTSNSNVGFTIPNYLSYHIYRDNYGGGISIY